MAKTILFKIWKFPQLSETFVVNQIVTAIKLGYEVKVLVGECLDFKENSNTQLIDEYDIRDKIIHEDYGVPKNKCLRIGEGFLLLLKFAPDWFLFRKFFKLSAKKEITLIYIFNFYRKFRKVDAFHIQFGTNKHPIDLLKKTGLLEGKLIVSFHGHDLYFPINNRIPSNGYYDVLFDSANYLVSNTPFLKEKLLEINAPLNKIEIIPVAVDTKFFKPSLINKYREKIRLVTVGRLETFKGHIWGIKAVELLVKKGHNILYSIAGAGSLDQELKMEVKNLGLQQFVRFEGKVTQSEVKELLKKSDVFLMTSITDPDYGVESQGLVTAEAQACGLPVVAFDSGGIKYTVQDEVTGFLCEEKNVECFASKIEELILNKEMRKKMSENAVYFINEHYSENSVLDKWKQLYS